MTTLEAMMPSWEEYLGLSQEMAHSQSDADQAIHKSSKNEAIQSGDHRSHDPYEDEILQSEKIKARSIVVDSLLSPGKFIP
jgi:hypothetical protein